MSGPEDVLSIIADAGYRALASNEPESSIHTLVSSVFDTLGDRNAHTRRGALKKGEKQFFVGGAFMVTPDRKYHMLVGNRGFPSSQRRLMVPIDGGHPGEVYASRAPLLLGNTDEHNSFRQYLSSSRMGSTIFAPMIWQGEFVGQLIFAAQARYTMREKDLMALVMVSHVACPLWIAIGGPDWLADNYPPDDGFYVEKEGLYDRYNHHD